MIGGIGSSTSVLTQNVVPTTSNTVVATPTAQGASGVNTALYQSFATALAAPGPLGLPTPINPEDASAILAQAELLLDETSAKNRANRIETNFGGARSSIAALNSSLGAITTNLNDRATAQTTLKTQQATVDDLAAHSGALGTVLAAYTQAAGRIKQPDDGQPVSGTTFKGQVDQAVADLQAKVAQGNLGAADLATLNGTIASLQAVSAGIDPSDTQKTYGAGDYAAARAILTSGSSTLASTKSDVDGQLSAAQTAVIATQVKIASLTAAINAGLVTLQQQTQALLVVFSQVATDTVGAGDHTRDQAKSTDLDKGFDALDEASRKFREDNLARTEDDAESRDAADKAVDAQRVADLVAGLVTGLASLVAVVRQEAGAPPGPDTNDARLSGNRFRFAL